MKIGQLILAVKSLIFIVILQFALHGSARSQQPAANPNLAPACPLDIIFILDESGSIIGSQTGTNNITTQLRAAANGLVNALNGTGTRLAIVEFNTSSRRALIGNSTAYQVVNSAYVNAFNTYMGPDNNNSASADNYDPEDYGSNERWTNWEAAFNTVQTINTTEGVAPLIIFFTDGLPTAYINSSGTITSGNSASLTAQSLNQAVSAANLVKAQGSHIFILGLPNPTLPESNAIAVSGPDKFPVPQGDFIKGDYSISSSQTIESDLMSISQLLCKADLRLQKSASSLVSCARSTVVFTLIVINDGLENTTGVVVKDYIPSGYNYVSDNGGGTASFSAGTVTWNVGNLNNAQSAQLQIAVTVNANGDYKNIAEITASSKADADSDPGNYNGAPLEDDEAEVSIVFLNCNDGNACTADICTNSNCSNPQVNCDDGNPQSTDICTGGTCTHTCNDNNACTQDSYVNGECIFSGGDCNDNNACTQDICNPATGCSNTENCDDGNPQSTDACANGVCTHTCDDNNACTQDSYANGACVFSGGDCNDNNACTQDICNPATGCSNTENCDDGNPQSVDACVNDVCTHTCNDGNACTIDSYVNSNCVFTLDCNDNNICTTDNCVSGNCQHPPFCNDDNNLCTQDLCRNANQVPVCIFTQIDCSDNVACTADFCTPSSGQCGHDASPCNSNIICPPKMIIVLDESGSIAGHGQGSIGVTTQVRNGVAGMFTAISETNISVAVVEFNSRARRAVINGTTAYQQITPGNLSGFMDYVTDNNTTPESSHFDPEDYLSNNTTTFTNWDDALKLVQSINSTDGNAPLVLFFTDGKPTAYNNSNGTVTTGTGSAIVAEALTRAIASANSVKTQSAHIFVVAFPNPGLTESNVQAISGTSRYPDLQPDFTKADYSIESSSSLENSLRAIASLLCKADLRLSMTASPAVACPGSTVVFTVKITNDGLDMADVIQVKNYLPNGYSYVSNSQGASFAAGAVTWNHGLLLSAKSDSIKITATVNPSGNYTNVAEVTFSNKGDNDSDPANFNGTPDEDDEAAASVSFQGCNGGGGCTSNGQCNDANACTADACSGGVCINSPNNCNDNNSCTVDGCNTSSGCTYFPITNCNNGDPCAGVNCDDGNPCTTDACTSGTCSHTPIQAQPSYLKITNPAKSWRKLKLGYSSNLYTPTQNVIAGGNTQMCITLRTIGTPEWSKMQMRPQGGSTPAVTLGSYISGSVAGFTTFCIPFSAFTGFNFSSISFIEAPYSNGASAFEIHISKIEFTGGTTPFLWFGDPHTNNYHDGLTGNSSTLPSTLIAGQPCSASKLSQEEGNMGNISNFENTRISAFPNPFKEQLNFEFSVADDSEISLELFSITGARIATIFNGKAEKEVVYYKTFEPGNLASGFYIYRLKTAASVITDKVLLTHLK